MPAVLRARRRLRRRGLLTTTAVRDGDEWVLNGQKVWTSGAQYSDYGAVIARTDPTVPKHNGITMFIVDMHAPGVTVRPLKVATGATPFNEVFFDQVRLPADAVIGEVNDGWRAAVVMLRNERVTIGTMGAPRTSPLSYHSLRDLAASLGDRRRPGLQQEARGAVRARARPCGCSASCCARRPWPGATRARAARWPSWPARSLASSRPRWPPTCSARRRPRPTARTSGRCSTAIISAPGWSIAGGTNEIQRNIIGERVLGLPKDPGVDRATPFNQLRVGTMRKN